jgi:uncharacterized membrane protein YfcA
MSDVLGFAGLFVAAVAAGAINSVAGGGTLISFPSLVAFGQPEIISNATNTAALWPGSLSSALGYRKDTALSRDLLALLLAPSLAGGLLGAFILVVTPPAIFRVIVPFLILFATLVFAGRKFIAQKFASQKLEEGRVAPFGRIWGFFFQLFVATYGGYFGAGIGILMLGSLGVMGLRDIHVMNALKTALAALINVTAFVFFAVKGLVVWPLAILMAVGSITGGYFGARGAKRVNQNILQLFIVAAGLVVSLWFILRVL